MRHERDMRGLLPIDEACKSIMPSLWDAYAKERDDARDVLRQLELRFASLDQERRLAPYKEARAAVTTRIRSGVKSNEFELYARLAGSLELQRIPASAIDGLEVDYERRTAVGDGLPPLYDLHIRLPPTAPIKRRHKPLPTDVLRSAALAVAKAYQPDDPPTFATWKEALEAHLGGPVTRATARKALNCVTFLKRKPGQKRRKPQQKRNRRS
jgi:hypothetical protein